MIQIESILLQCYMMGLENSGYTTISFSIIITN